MGAPHMSLPFSALIASFFFRDIFLVGIQNERVVGGATLEIEFLFGKFEKNIFLSAWPEEKSKNINFGAVLILELDESEDGPARAVLNAAALNTAVFVEGVFEIALRTVAVQATDE